MYNYLMRELAPFGPDVWAKIDDMVVNIVKKTLVARRFMEIAGPVGWGVEMVPRFGFDTEDGALVANITQQIPLQEIAQDFKLRARHLVAAGQTPFGLDLGAAAIAAINLAKAEDALVIGTLMAEAGCHGELLNWTVLGEPLRAVANAVAQLTSAGMAPPYALVVSPTMYAQLVGLINNGVRELEMVRELATGGIFQYTDDQVLGGRGLVVSQGAWNSDLVVGQDVATAYLANEGLDQRFRVFETIAPRVKLPGSICVLG